MTRNINGAYLNSLLTDAAYVNFNGTFSSNLESKLTKPQAVFLLENFKVVAAENKSDLSLLSSGFDATVWKGQAGTEFANQVYVSMRGTAGATDIADDISLAARGIPYEQVRDMANWWQLASNDHRIEVAA